MGDDEAHEPDEARKAHCAARKDRGGCKGHKTLLLYVEAQGMRLLIAK